MVDRHAPTKNAKQEDRRPHGSTYGPITLTEVHRLPQMITLLDIASV